MNCLYCGQRLSGNQDPGLGSFCSADHQRKFGVDIRVLLQLQNPGRLEIPRPESTASPNCLYCSQPLSIRKRLKGGQFCSSEHEDLYFRQWNEQAMARLGGAAALEEDLYGVDLTEGDPQAIPRCQYCDEPLSVGRRLKRRRFCSEEHEEQYRQQQSNLIFSRLRLEDRPRARPRRLWDPRNTEGCAGFGQMPVPPKQGRLTLYPAGGIQFSISPAILRFGGEILKLSSGGAVARPRLGVLPLGRKEMAAAGKVDLEIAIPPRPAVICRGEPAAEPPGKLIALPCGAGCAAIRKDLPREGFKAPELLRPPPDAGFLDYARTQIPERFRRPLLMPRMAVVSLGSVVAEDFGQEEAASGQSGMPPPAPAGPVAGAQRWETVTLPPPPVSGGTWMSVAAGLLLPRAGGPLLHGGRLAGSECSNPRVPARIAGRRAPGWIDGSGKVNMPRRRRETPRHAPPAGAPVAVLRSAVDRGYEERAERGWAVARTGPVLPVPQQLAQGQRVPRKLRPEEQLRAGVPRLVAWAKECCRGVPGQEMFLASGSRKTIFPRMDVASVEGRVVTAGFRIARTGPAGTLSQEGTRESTGRRDSVLRGSSPPHGTAGGFLSVEAAVATPRIEALRAGEMLRNTGYRNPLPLGAAHMRADAAEWRQEPAAILVRRAAPGKACARIGRGGPAALTNFAPGGWLWTRQDRTWLAGGASLQPACPVGPRFSTEARPVERDYVSLTTAGGGLHGERGNGSCGDWVGATAPLLPSARQSPPAGTVLRLGHAWPVAANARRMPWAMAGEYRFAGAGRVGMPESVADGGVRLLRRTGERIEWSAKAGVRSAAGGEWRERSLFDPRLPGPREDGFLKGMRPRVAGGLGWRAGLQENEGFAREMVIAYRFLFPAAAAAELEQLPARRARAKGKIVVLR